MTEELNSNKFSYPSVELSAACLHCFDFVTRLTKGLELVNRNLSIRTEKGKESYKRRIFASPISDSLYIQASEESTTCERGSTCDHIGNAQLFPGTFNRGLKRCKISVPFLFVVGHFWPTLKCPHLVFLEKAGSFVWPLMTLREAKLPPLFSAYPVL